jgi:hypothetical protein
VDKISRLPYFAQPSTPKWQLVLAQTLFDQTVGTVLVISGFFVFFGFINAAADGALLSVGVPALLAQGVAKVGGSAPGRHGTPPPIPSLRSLPLFLPFLRTPLLAHMRSPSF